MTARLRRQFTGLERFADTWCLASETERFERQLASSMGEMQDLYDVCFPPLGEAIDQCDKHLSTTGPRTSRIC